VKVTRQIVFVLIAIVMVTGLYYGFRSYGWSGAEEESTATGVTTAVLKFSCAPLFGTDYAHGPAYIPSKANGVPCGQRRQYQIMDGVDLGAGSLGIGALMVWPLRRRLAAAPEEAPAV
jgi:hypothetical protein